MKHRESRDCIRFRRAVEKKLNTITRWEWSHDTVSGQGGVTCHDSHVTRRDPTGQRSHAMITRRGVVTCSPRAHREEEAEHEARENDQ